MKAIDLTGKKFSRLLVIGREGTSSHGSILWACQCDCGKQHVVASPSLRRGLTKSCGCLQKEVRGKATITHGMSKTETYRIYIGVIDRCYNQNHTSYIRYGAKGVTVCDRWRFGENNKSGFECFFEDMGERPEEHQINRKNVSMVYCEENCEWVNLSLQAFDKGMLKTNTSGRTGVNFDVDCGLWCAQLNKQGKVFKKRFKDYEEACAYREALEIEHFGFTKK
jgi:hypothetical protein